MFNKIILSIIISFFSFSCAAFSWNTNTGEYGGASITDFTLYKVIPQKEPAFNPDIKTKIKKPPIPVRTKAPIKTVQKVVKPKHLFNAINNLPAKQVNKAHNPRVKVSSVKSTAAAKKLQTKKAITAPASHGNELQSPSGRQSRPSDSFTPASQQRNELLKKKQSSSFNAPASHGNNKFNKDDYVKNLGNYLNNDKLTDDSPKIKTTNKMNSYDYIVKPSVSLGIVLFLILALAWLYSKVKGVRPDLPLFNKFGDSNMNRFKIIATSALGQGKVIQLVEINGKQLVVGSTNNNINLLTEITPEEMENLQTKIKTKKESNDKAVSQDDHSEYFDPETYSAKYSELYKEYIEKQDKK